MTTADRNPRAYLLIRNVISERTSPEVAEVLADEVLEALGERLPREDGTGGTVFGVRHGLMYVHRDHVTVTDLTRLEAETNIPRPERDVALALLNYAREHIEVANYLDRFPQRIATGLDALAEPMRGPNS